MHRQASAIAIVCALRSISMTACLMQMHGRGELLT